MEFIGFFFYFTCQKSAVIKIIEKNTSMCGGIDRTNDLFSHFSSFLSFSLLVEYWVINK